MSWTESDSSVASKSEVKRPGRYRVILLNDDYTTMEFVILILVEIFRKTQEEAVAVMLEVHKKGRGVAGIYSKEIAETKVDEVHKKARENEFPLRCTIEKVS